MSFKQGCNHNCTGRWSSNSSVSNQHPVARKQLIDNAETNKTKLSSAQCGIFSFPHACGICQCSYELMNEIREVLLQFRPKVLSVSHRSLIPNTCSLWLWACKFFSTKSIPLVIYIFSWFLYLLFRNIIWTKKMVYFSFVRLCLNKISLNFRVIA